jgi:hypothetical protein
VRAASDLGIVEPLLAICQRALAPMPEDRYPHAAALAADLQAYLAGTAVAAYREGPITCTVRQAVKLRWPILLVATACVAVVALLLLDRDHETRYGHLLQQMEASDAAYADQLAQAAVRGATQDRRLVDFERRLGWRQVADLDFSKPIDARLEVVQVNERMGIESPATDLLQQADGVVELRPAPHRSFLRWREGVGEDARIDVEVERAPASGWNLDLSVAGDSCTGYRLRLDGTTYLGLETVSRGWADQLVRIAQPPIADRTRLTISLRHHAGHISVILDGAELIRYMDPRPVSGPQHRCSCCNSGCSDGAFPGVGCVLHCCFIDCNCPINT